MNVQCLIERLQDFAPNTEVTLAVDDPNGLVKSVCEVDLDRVESVNGKPFLVGVVEK